MYQELIYCSSKRKSFPVSTRRIEQLKLLSVSFLQDWDLVSPSNQTILFAEAADPGTVITAKLPAGNYTVGNFPSAVATALTQAGSQSYTCTYDSISRRLTITAPSDFKILQGNRGTSAYTLMGMSRLYETGYGKSHVLKNVVNLSGSNPVFLCSNIRVEGTKFLTDFNDEAQMVLAAICPDSFGDVVSWVNPSSDFLSVNDQITSISFFLVDSVTGQELILNGPLTVTVATQDDLADR
ncbi:hypothetical protein DFS34DRAFT_655118 [Phlyctochytrium arcticum]|nr:hypothetical protein DFS34DRAFT_655118 [Phlyctochytrium arcticum]